MSAPSRACVELEHKDEAAHIFKGTDRTSLAGEVEEDSPNGFNADNTNVARIQ